LRIESSVTAISWIPEAATEGTPKIPFELGIGHYDAPPPDRLEPLERLRDEDRFREANHLAGWIDVEDGRIVDYGHSGGGLVGTTTFKGGPGEGARCRDRLRDVAARPGGWPGFRAVRADRGRPCRLPCAAYRQRPAVHAYQLRDIVDDAGSHDRRRRQLDLQPQRGPRSARGEADDLPEQPARSWWHCRTTPLKPIRAACAPARTQSARSAASQLAAPAGPGR
jgi:hypothetical protein